MKPDENTQVSEYRVLSHNHIRKVMASPETIEFQAVAHGHAGMQLPTQRDSVAQVHLEAILAQQSTMTKLGVPGNQASQVSEIMARGARVHYEQTGERATIVKLNVARTKSGNPMHEIITDKGDRIRASVKHLKTL